MKLCMIRSLALIITGAMGCASATDDNASASLGTSSDALSIVQPESICKTIPDSLRGKRATTLELGMPSYAAPGKLLFAPHRPNPQDDMSIVFESNDRTDSGYSTKVSIRYTTDGWTHWQEKDMGDLCETVDGRRVYGVSLGKLDAGTEIEFAAKYEKSLSAYGIINSGWLNDGGKNFSVRISAPSPLQWLGDTQARQYGLDARAGSVAANHQLQIVTQTYPADAQANLTLYYADASYKTIRSIPMMLDADGVGANRNNAQWVAAIPGGDVKAGQIVKYWIRGDDASKTVNWDNNAGQNYTVTPKAMTVEWIGGFGGYRPIYNEYFEHSSFFDTDLATATGCWNHGASLSSYSSRAVRVNVPGITDRVFASDEDARKAASLLTVEAFTNAHANRDWAAYPARFAHQVGADFVFTFFEYTDVCAGGGDLSRGVADGEYEYKIRASADKGASYAWRGADDGANLKLHYAVGCSYFNNRNDCMSTR